MDPYELGRFVLRIVNAFTSFGEVVAGSVRERMLVDEIRSLVEDLSAELRIEWVPVLNWEETYCNIETEYGAIRCALQPPLMGGDVEGEARVLELQDVLLKRVSGVEDRIAVLEAPSDPDDFVLISLKLVSMGVRGIVFVDRAEALRRIVIVDQLIPRYGACAAPQIPIVVVPRSAFALLKKSQRIRIAAKAFVKEGVGLNLVACSGGRDRGTLYLAAHHDHWFSGFTDNLLGVGIAVSLFRSISMYTSFNAVFASFTAEEGFPSTLSSFYWLVGSRHHIRANAERVLEDVIAVLNFDVVYRPPIRMACGGIEALAIGRRVASDRIEFDQIIFDSYAFSSVGVPAITFHSFETALSAGIYHSTLDRPKLEVLEAVEEAISLALRAAREFTMHTAELPRLFIEEASRLLAEKQLQAPLPLEVVKSMARLLMLIERVPLSQVTRLMRVFNRSLFAQFITKSFFEELGEREQSGFAPWVPSITEIPLGVEYRSKDNVVEKLRNIAASLDILSDAYMLSFLQ